jgi:hypothetical protein
MYAANPFRVDHYFGVWIPGFSLRSNPGLALVNAFGVTVNTQKAYSMYSERLRRYLNTQKAYSM